jgi:hypothetical protein
MKVAYSAQTLNFDWYDDFHSILLLTTFVESVRQVQLQVRSTGNNTVFVGSVHLAFVIADKLSTSSGRQIECYQERCARELQDYASQSNPSEVGRSMQLCLRLATLRLLSPTIVEELFFAGLIGSVEINSIIPYIMRLDAVEYGALLRGGGIAVTGAVSTANESPAYSTYLQFASTPAEPASVSPTPSAGGESQGGAAHGDDDGDGDGEDQDMSKLEED